MKESNAGLFRRVGRDREESWRPWEIGKSPKRVTEGGGDGGRNPAGFNVNGSMRLPYGPPLGSVRNFFVLSLMVTSRS
jgi:hypothetical protein